MKKTLNGNHHLHYAKLTKAHRIKSKSLLASILKNGIKIKSTNFGIIFFWKASTDSILDVSTKFAISVSKKVSKKAVERNRLKRVYKHAWQLVMPKWEAQVPIGFTLCLFLVIYQRTLNSLENVIQEMETLLQKVFLNLPHAKN
jgi:ribonuclease P protein component